MNNSESGMAKKNIVVRFLAFSLAAIMMLGAFAVVPVLSVESEPEAEQSQSAQNNSEIVYDEDVLSITVDGEERTELEIYENEKVTIKAEGVLAAKYQWQILHPERSGLWVDIYEETKATLDVSLALTSNMEHEDGKTYLRCLAYEAEGAYVTDVLEVATLEGTKPIDAPEIPKLETGKVDYNLVQEDEETPEVVTITIEYLRYDFLRDDEGRVVVDAEENPVLSDEGVMAFRSYVATIRYGASLTTTVPNPTLVGYNAFLDDETDPCESVDIKETGVNKNITHTVHYKPAEVSYSVRYYLQNIYDDLYVENSSLKEKYSGTGLTGSTPPDNVLKDEVEGFTALYYQPDTIAADGSTVFEVYYERNYYLMEFNCNEGYGTDTVYVRYGSYISVPDPVRHGWQFVGWDLTATEAETKPSGMNDGAKDELPATMPAYNTAYKAIWKEVETSYTVVYWRENADDYGYSYWDSEQVGLGTDGKPDGTVISNSEISATDYSTQKPNTSDSTYFTYNSYKTEYEESRRDDLRNGKVVVEGDGSTVVHVYYSRNYYTILFKGYGECCLETHTHGDGKCKNSLICGYGDHIHSDECVSTLTCEIEEHTHTDECIICGKTEHQHTSACYNCGKQEHSHSQANGCNLSCIHTSHTLDCYSAPDSDYRDYYLGETTKPNRTLTNNGNGIFYYTRNGNTYYYYLNIGDKWYCVGYDNWWGNFEPDAVNQITYECTHSVTHPDDCYTCDKEVHTHTDECGYKDEEHTHVDSCYKDTEHTHNDDCYTWKCGASAHTHIDSCYGDCTLVEHQHTSYNPNCSTNSANNVIYTITAKYEQNISAIWPTASLLGAQDNVPNNSDGNAVNGSSSVFRGWSGLASAESVSKRVTMTTELCDTNDGVKEATANYGSDYIVNLYYMFESFDTDSPPNGNDRIYYNGKYYDKSDDYSQTVAANSDTFSAKTITGMSNDGVEKDRVSGNQYNNFLYYTRSRVTLQLQNINKIIYTQGNIMYEIPVVNLSVDGVPLKDYVPPYPETYEPGAYEFGGWYTTPECFDGTEVDWDKMTMPNNTLTLYAKWTPIIRTVTFYSAYSDIQKDEDDKTDKVYHFMHTDDVPHGTLLGSAYSYTPDFPTDLDLDKNYDDPLAQMYEFVGWFYIDENGKKRFAPDSMEINRDLVIFAEWNTSVDTTYEIQYVLKEAVTQSKIPTLSKDYAAGDAIADKLYAHSSVGKTKTFGAKGVSELYSDFKQSFFPLVSSHSILMEQDGSLNTYTFEYVYDPVVYYKVRYMDYLTRTEIADSKVVETDKAIVTEKFYPIDGYIPQNYYITKSLASDGDADKEHVIEENIITFYYTKDEDHGMYSIEYYLEDPTATGDDEKFYMYESVVGIADTGTLIYGTQTPIDKNSGIRQFDGYKYLPEKNKVITYSARVDSEGNPIKDANGNSIVDETVREGADAGNPPHGEVTYSGLTIKIYYECKPYDYEFIFREHGAKPEDADLAAKVTGSAKFGSTVNHTAPETISVKVGDEIIIYEYNYSNIDNPDVSERIKYITIREFDTGEDNPNKQTFWYVKKEYPVEYHAVCTVPDLDSLNYVSLLSESAALASNLAGSTAMVGKGFQFVGWYMDEECTTPVADEHPDWLIAPPDDSGITEKIHLKPKAFKDNPTDPNGTNHYYALFEPVYGSLKLTKSAGTTENNESFLFHIKGKAGTVTGHIDMIVTITDSGSKILNKLPIGSYTVTEMESWSWTSEVPRNEAGELMYPIEQNVTVKESTPESTPVEILFGDCNISSDWLTGEDIDVPENNNKND